MHFSRITFTIVTARYTMYIHINAETASAHLSVPMSGYTTNERATNAKLNLNFFFVSPHERTSSEAFISILRLFLQYRIILLTAILSQLFLDENRKKPVGEETRV